MRSAVAQIDDEAINVFTDGSSLPSPRRGGVGVHIVVVNEAGHEVVHDLGLAGFAGGNNNEMELQAAIEALHHLNGRYSPVSPSDYRKILVFTDSMYVAEHFDDARFRWPTNGWMTRNGDPVANADLWRNLTRIAAKVHRRVEIRWCQGHSRKNPHNKAADKLAKTSARGALRQPVRPKRVRRRTTESHTEPGSIIATGQQVRIRVVTDEWLPVQRMYRYKIEVLDHGSPFDGCVDDYFSEVMLSAGHTYDVRLGDDPKQRRIAALIGEVETQP